MKIDEIRKTPPACHLVMFSEGDGLKALLGEMIFRVDNNYIETKTFYANEKSDVITLDFTDKFMIKLRDWLCELYGLPEKK